MYIGKTSQISEESLITFVENVHILVENLHILVKAKAYFVATYTILKL